MKSRRKREKESEPHRKQAGSTGIPFLSTEAVDLYFVMASKREPVSLEELRDSGVCNPDRIEQVVGQLVEQGLVRRIPVDGRYEAIAPVEAVAVHLESLRESLQELKESLPQQLDESLRVHIQEEELRRRLSELSDLAPELGMFISSALRELLGSFHAQAEELRGAPAFEALTEKLKSTLLRDVERRMAQIQSITFKCQSVEEFNALTSQLKRDLLDIIGISLSDLGEKTFRLREMEEFRRYLAQLREETPALVERHLSTFEKEMSTLEASIGDLFETKYKLGAFKGVVEHFVREHVMKALQELEANLQRSLTESFQEFLATAQERFEEASAAAQQSFEELKKTLATRLEEAMDLALGEAAHRYQESAAGISEELEQIAKKFQECFAKELDAVISTVKANARQVDQKLLETVSRLSQLQEKELTPHIDSLVQKVERIIGSTARQAPKTLKQIRSEVVQTVEEKVTPLIEETGAYLALASKSLDVLWRRAAEYEPSVFELYRFLQGEEEFTACLTDLLVRTRRHLLIMLPRPDLAHPHISQLLERLLLFASVRLVVGGDKKSPALRQLQEMAAAYPNLQIRHDPRGDLWGALRDHEEILIGRTARGIPNVNGISSRHEDHVSLLRPLLENRWVRARPIPSLPPEEGEEEGKDGQ